jgi:thioredoxin-dependent peroxiredoxin
MKLLPDQQAPAFSTKDVFGRTLDLSALRGRKVYLAFERNAGCPVCTLRTHELLKNSKCFADKHAIVILVFESTPEKMREHLETDTPFYFVADPQNTLYNQYGVERSLVKIMRGLLHGIIEKVSAGKKLFKKPTRQDGHTDRVPAEFIIREDGKLTATHYSRFLGDQLPITTIVEYLA